MCIYIYVFRMYSEKRHSIHRTTANIVQTPSCSVMVMFGYIYDTGGSL